METHLRSLAKAATWRAGGLAVTFAVAWAVTGRLEVAASIGIVDTVVKLAAFYVHERLWLKSRFGLRRKPEYEI